MITITRFATGNHMPKHLFCYEGCTRDEAKEIIVTRLKDIMGHYYPKTSWVMSPQELEVLKREVGESTDPSVWMSANEHWRVNNRGDIRHEWGEA